MRAERMVVIRSKDAPETRIIVAGGVSVEVFEIYDWASEDQPMYAEKPVVAFNVGS